MLNVLDFYNIKWWWLNKPSPGVNDILAPEIIKFGVNPVVELVLLLTVNTAHANFLAQFVGLS